MQLEELFAKEKEEKKYRNCPHCNFVVSKTEGCNFMTCGSKFCQNRKYFCYVCGSGITPSDSAHFHKNNSFLNFCVNNPYIEPVNPIDNDTADLGSFFAEDF